MTFKINSDKSASIIKKIRDFIHNPRPTIRDLASVIDPLLSFFSSHVFWETILQIFRKKMLLKRKKFDDKLSKLNADVERELRWWIDHIPIASRKITESEVDFTITTDAMDATDGYNPIDGMWGKIGDHI